MKPTYVPNNSRKLTDSIIDKLSKQYKSFLGIWKKYNSLIEKIVWMRKKHTWEREIERKRSIRRRQERDGGPRRRETLLGELSDKNSLHAWWPTCSVPTTVARVHA
ncbi:hypothetical protein YC2023_074780 [Brassica napus]